MASSCHRCKSQFSKAKLSLDSVLTTRSLPIIVRTCTDGYSPKDDLEDTNRIPVGTEMLLERTAKVEYAHIRVLPFDNDSNITVQNNDEVIQGHNQFVDEEFLIPVSFPCRLKIVHRPNKRKRFASISEILENPPRYVRADTSVKSVPFGDQHQEMNVPMRTQLEIKTTVISDIGNSIYLECEDGNGTTYMFSEKSPVNFTAVLDDKTHSLQDISAKKFMLPKVVELQSIFPEVIAQYDDELAANILTMTNGPIEILNFVPRDILISWIQLQCLDSFRRKYKIVLIPSALWPHETVQIHGSKSENDKLCTINDYFTECGDSSIVDNKLYVMLPDECIVTSLLKEITLDTDDKSDNTHSDDCYEIGPLPPQFSHDESPPVPQRINVTPYRNDVTETVLLPTAKASGKQTDKGNIFGRFLKPKNTKPPPIHRKPNNLLHPNEQCKHGADKLPICKDNVVETILELQERSNRHFPHDEPIKYGSRPLPKTPSEKQLILKNDDDGYEDIKIMIEEIPSSRITPTYQALKESDIVTFQNDGYETVDRKEMTTPSTGKRARARNKVTLKNQEAHGCTVNDDGYVKMDEFKVDQQNPTLPQEKQPIRRLDDDGYDIVEVNGSNGKSPKYVSVIGCEFDKVNMPNQNADDFFEYTVEEVEECFNICVNGKLAKQCKEHKIDGAFFKVVNIEDFLTKDPFLLTGIELIKTQKAIDGWRPKHNK